MMGVMGVSMMNTPNNPKIKEKFPNLIKGIIENIKVNIIPYRITNKTGRLCTSIHCPNGGHRIKPGKEIRCIKFEKEKQNYFNLQIISLYMQKIQSTSKQTVRTRTYQ